MWPLSVGTLLVCALGGFLAYGPYQDDGTWNLVRNRVTLQRLLVPAQERSHFRFYVLRREAPAKADPGSVLFIPGHGGSWTQGINLASYMSKQSAAGFYALDFHSSASALHWSVVEAQADFAAAVTRQLARDRKGTLVLLGHSMGGLVALEALRLLGTQRSLVGALVLISSPTAEHPLLLEARFAHRAAAVREEAWAQQSPSVVAVTGGATDALMPMVATTLPPRARGSMLPLPAARDVYSSFSHVNLLFSRHSLHALSALLSGALAGRLLLAAGALQSPLSKLLRAAELVLVPSPWSGQRLAQVADSTSSMIAPDAKLSQLLGQEADAITLLHTLEDGVVYLLPAPAAGGTLTVMLQEEPRLIKRAPESTTRGENFDPKDLLDCSSAVSVALSSGAGDDTVASLLAGSSWLSAKAVDIQYPSKACFYQLPSAPAQSEGKRVVASLMVTAPRSIRRFGWVQWRQRPAPAVSDVGCDLWPAGHLPAMSWLASVVFPARCVLPTGRGIITRMVLPSSRHLLHLLPLDIRLAQAQGQSNLTWRPPVLLLLADPENGNDTRMAALPSTSLGQPRPVWFRSWAAESNPEIFAPRILETAEDGPTIVTVLGHPDVEITLEVQGNAFSALAEIFRRFLRPLAAAWLGAATALTAAELSSHERPMHGSFSWAWLLGSLTLKVVGEASLTLLPLQAIVLALGLGLGHLSMALGRLPSICRKHRTGCTEEGTGNARHRLLCGLGLLALALLHPGGCLLVLVGTCLAQLAGMPRNDGAQAPLLGLTSVLAGPMLLCHLQSILFMVWFLLGQHRRPSAEPLQHDLDSSLPSSPHAASLLADAIFRAPWVPFPPALGLLAPAAAVSATCFRGPVPARVALPRLGGALLAVAVAVTVTGSPSSVLELLCLPVLAALSALLLLPNSCQRWFQDPAGKKTD